MKLVRISLPTLPRREFRVAPLDGSGELLADPGDPLSARRIVSHLATNEPEGWLEDVSVSVFDRLCAAIFQDEFSSSAECRSECEACGAEYHFNFDIADLLAAQDEAAGKLRVVPDEAGYWQIDDNLSLRPPTLGDLDAKIETGMLVRSGEPGDPRIDTFLESAAPILTLQIGTQCPNCSEAQEVAFDMARYLVASIAAEHAFLVRETHLLASRYGWSHGSIMALPRKDRRAFAALIESERSSALARRTA